MNPAASESTSSDANSSNITFRTGDLFNAPPDSILIHACNCQGSWNSGVAAGFKAKFPKAYAIYRSYCLSNQPATPSSPSPLLGTSLLIPPQPGDKMYPYWVGCLFTSTHYGRKVDPPEKIMRSTKEALDDMVKLVEEREKNGEMRGNESEWHLPRINSLRFRVTWEVTMRQLEETGRSMVVWVYDGEDTGKGVPK
ncbi:hypothetical protein EX30DRAFT_369766 [Ascodesmis nigricans]|uniref:Uncharacterized protein n=1 Tax=Ascodesmis nigricans TaxID=341454 RepID=A0A4S2N1B2_9PEZI|nr:hypothetical protein EX30DRAFT_369766 [Ascodesmis nigricans]